MTEGLTFRLPGPDRRLADMVDAPGGGPVTIGLPGRVVELPRAAGAAVRKLLEQLAAGTAVHLIADDAELTTQQAGDLLGISRTYVAHLVDTGKLPGHRVGTHRRLRASDVLAYKERRDARLAAVDQIAEADQTVGVPYK